MAILQLNHIVKNFGDTRVLKGIQLDVEEGEFITFLGSSGCGKTTTLRIIAGLEIPTEGSVILEGKDVTFLEPEKRNMNMVFQNYALFPHMNVYKNIAYGLKVRRLPKKEIQEKVTNALAMVQLEGYEKRMPSELSGGQRQRVAIARAIVNNPKVLLLDEPLGALDLQLRRQMQLELKRLQKKLNMTFLYITHDQEESINMSDRIAVMRDGQLEQVGTADEIYNHPKNRYVAQFVGSANVLEAGQGLIAVRREYVEVSSVFVEGSIMAVVLEKSFAGGQMNMLLELSDGTQITASRHGINVDFEPGQTVYVYWKPEHAAAIEP